MKAKDQMLRITFCTILFLTGCENDQLKQNPVAEVQQIESPLQNTVEGMAKAKPLLEPPPADPDPPI